MEKKQTLIVVDLEKVGVLPKSVNYTNRVIIILNAKDLYFVSINIVKCLRLNHRLLRPKVLAPVLRSHQVLALPSALRQVPVLALVLALRQVPVLALVLALRKVPVPVPVNHPQQVLPQPLPQVPVSLLQVLRRPVRVKVPVNPLQLVLPQVLVLVPVLALVLVLRGVQVPVHRKAQVLVQASQLFRQVFLRHKVLVIRPLIQVFPQVILPHQCPRMHTYVDINQNVSGTGKEAWFSATPNTTMHVAQKIMVMV